MMPDENPLADVFKTLLAVLARLDEAEEHVAAIHVTSALEALSPDDPRIPDGPA